mmetsp:Transcript_30845/g.57527  ORF Transcript_30845/g.57527 Transcript_30845/m.57527 type:complete len:533 (+) Transcript_30845:88-1686(+)
MQSKWLQQVGSEINLPALSEEEHAKLLEEIEAEIKAVVQLSFKLQKRAKKRVMTVEDVNLALTVLNGDEVYGFLGKDQKTRDLSSRSTSVPSSAQAEATINAMARRNVDLATFACQPLPKCPLIPQPHFHWLAIAGNQPLIPQNPDVVVYDCAADTSGLPREIAYFYTKITQLILSATASEGSGKSVDDACRLLARDNGLQILVGYLCRFIFVNIRRNLKNTFILYALLQCIHSLVLNSSLNLESCLHQLLPSVLSCIVGSKVGDPDVNEHSRLSSAHIQFPVGLCSVWSELQPLHVRNFGAVVVRDMLARYGGTFPELLPRVCKTFLQASFTTATSSSSAVAMRYGGIVGLGMLGETVISDVLLPNICTILHFSKSFSVQEVTNAATNSSQLIGSKNRQNSGQYAQKFISDADASHSVVEMLLVTILQWHIRKCLANKRPISYFEELRSRIVISDDFLVTSHGCRGDVERTKRRKIEDTSVKAEVDNRREGVVSNVYHDWDEFIEQHIEKFVPSYVASSSTNISHCTDLVI